MAKSLDEGDLKQLVIEAVPAAQVTFELARQLVDVLPLDSLEALQKAMEQRNLKVGGTTLSGTQLSGVLPQDAFPIRKPEELVRRVAAAVRVGAALAAQGTRPIRDEALGELAASLAVSTGGAPSTALGYFGGPSIFGSEQRDSATPRGGN